MTNEEAIKILTFTKGLEDTLGNFDGGIKNSDLSKSLAMAIEALGHQPCYDCISRQDAIDAVRKAYENDEMLDGYEYRLGELPSTQVEQRWIPVSEWLPLLRYSCNVSDDVLITNGYETDMGYLVERKGKIFWHYYSSAFEVGIKDKDDDATAWMPLPQPYKAESEDKE